MRLFVLVLFVASFSVFSLQSYADDSFEPNDVLVQATVLPMNYAVSYLDPLRRLARQSNADWYKIEVYCGIARIQLSSLNVEEIELNLYDGDEVLVSTSTLSLNQRNINLTANYTGVYYIKVSGQNQGTEYDLSWSQTNVFYNCDDGYESNNSLAQAYNLTSREGYFLSQYKGKGLQFDQDVYEIQVSNNYLKVDAEILFPVFAGSLQLSLLSETGVVLATSLGEFGFEKLHFQVPAPGKYFLKVTGSNQGVEYDMLWGTNWSGALQNIQVGHRGQWYHPQKSGQGFQIDYINRASGPDELAVAWYTYDPVNPGKQLWIVGYGAINGTRADLTFYTVGNGVFTQPSGNLNFWGTGRVEFYTCGNGRIYYDTNRYGEDFRIRNQAPIELTRLTPVPFTDGGTALCVNESAQAAALNKSKRVNSFDPKYSDRFSANFLNALSAVKKNSLRKNKRAKTEGEVLLRESSFQYGHTGNWYHQPHSGQGILFEYVQFVGNPDDTMVMGWYTYDPKNPGKPYWIVGQLDRVVRGENGAADIALMTLYTTEAGTFNRPSIRLIEWGTGAVTFDSCTSGIFSYQSSLYDEGQNVQGVFAINTLTPTLFDEVGQPLCR